jgi:hypothetical protein
MISSMRGETMTATLKGAESNAIGKIVAINGRETVE